MQKILKTIFKIISILTILIIFSSIAISTVFSSMKNKIEPNLNFINSTYRFLYFDNAKDTNYNLCSIRTDGQDRKLLEKNVNKYNFNTTSDQIAFITRGDKHYLKVLSLNDNSIVYETLIHTQKFNGEDLSYRSNAPQFSFDNKMLLHDETNPDYSRSLYIINLQDKTKNFILKKNEMEIWGEPRWLNKSNDIIYFSNDYRGNTYYLIKNPLTDKKIGKLQTYTKDMLYFNNGTDTNLGYSGDNRYNSNLQDKDCQFYNDTNGSLFLRCGSNSKCLVEHRRGSFIYDSQEIYDYDYTSDLKYLIFSFNGEIYVVDIETGKTGFVTNGTKPRFIGNNQNYKIKIKNAFYNF